MRIIRAKHVGIGKMNCIISDIACPLDMQEFHDSGPDLTTVESVQAT